MKENYWKKGTSLHAGSWGSHTNTGFWGLRDWGVKHCEERFRRAFQHMEEERKWVSVWDGWMASLTRWTWVSVNSGSWWWTGRPGVLRFLGSQRVGHDWATDLIWSISVCVCVWLFGTPWTVARQAPSSIHAIFQARILEQVAISYSSGSFDSGTEPGLLRLLRWQVDSYHCATWEAHFCIYIHMCMCVYIYIWIYIHTYIFISSSPKFQYLGGCWWIRDMHFPLRMTAVEGRVFD